MVVNSKDLEKALENSDAKKEEKQQSMPKEMEIGFHQGALNTLINERNEMIKIIQQIESVMSVHLKRLEELGVKINFGKPEEGK